MHVQTRMEGDEHGVVVFVPGRGVLGSRERRGTMTGYTTVVGGPQTRTTPQRSGYKSTIKLEAPSR